MLVANLSALFLWIAISSCVIAIPTPTNGDRVMSPRGLKAVKRAESTESTWHVSSNPSQGSTTGHHQPGGIGR
ncbi:hypothetical protein Pst134EB_031020 [Puccinia striiformis f. sp. tritici]|nr:hypothetical protein Pst134EB_031020 [Puccinia striiformis f. sp. tritici]